MCTQRHSLKEVNHLFRETMALGHHPSLTLQIAPKYLSDPSEDFEPIRFVVFPKRGRSGRLWVEIQEQGGKVLGRATPSGLFYEENFFSPYMFEVLDLLDQLIQDPAPLLREGKVFPHSITKISVPEFALMS